MVKSGVHFIKALLDLLQGTLNHCLTGLEKVLSLGILLGTFHNIIFSTEIESMNVRTVSCINAELEIVKKKSDCQVGQFRMS